MNKMNSSISIIEIILFLILIFCSEISIEVLREDNRHIREESINKGSLIKISEEEALFLTTAQKEGCHQDLTIVLKEDSPLDLTTIILKEGSRQDSLTIIKVKVLLLLTQLINSETFGESSCLNLDLLRAEVTQEEECLTFLDCSRCWLVIEGNKTKD